MKFHRLSRTGMTLLLSLSMLAGCGQKKTEEPDSVTQTPAAETMTPSPEATQTPTQTPTQEPTQEPTQIPTQEPTEEPEATETAESYDWLDGKLKDLKEKNPEYNSYHIETFQADGWCYVVLADPGQDKEDTIEYVADIWALNKDQQVQLEDDNCIAPNKYGMEVIGGESYFRYDVAYATSNMTYLNIGVKDRCQTISLGGELDAVNGDELSYFVSMYDVCFSKEDGMGLGHTWKRFYGYIKDHEFYEYEPVVISEEEFLTYEGAKEIIHRLTEEYDSSDYQLSFEYKKRENGLIHVNIHQESDTEIVNHFETERIKGNTLEKIDEGEGAY